MTEIQDPGAPRTDPMAENAARNMLADRSEMFGNRRTAESIADWIVQAHTVTWERDVNSAGVPVRRYVLRGQWEVDPEAPTLGPGDVVRYRDRRDGGREWTIRQVEIMGSVLLPTGYLSMTSPGADEVAEHQFAYVSQMEIIRRAER